MCLQVGPARAGDGLAGAGAGGGYKRRTLSGPAADWLRARIAAGPFTLQGLSDELAEVGIKAHQKMVWVFVHDEGLSFKKNSAGRGAGAS